MPGTATYPITTSPTDLAYLAGVIDGEGSICIFNSNGRTKGKTYARGRPILLVANTDIRLLNWIKAKVGGRVYAVRHRSNPSHWKQVYHWETGWQHGRAVLEACLPFLVIKQDRALLFVEFCKTCRRYGIRGVPKDIAARRQQIIDAMRTLNQRGMNNALERGRRRAAHGEGNNHEAPAAVV